MQLRTHTHSDGLVLSSNHTHTYRRADCFFFCYVYKNGRQCTKYRHIWPKSRARKLWLYTTSLLLHFCLPFTHFLVLLSLFCFVLCVSVLLLYLVYDLHSCCFVLVTLSNGWTVSYDLFVSLCFSFARFDYYWNN